jgi:hypothetical protein
VKKDQFADLKINVGLIVGESDLPNFIINKLYKKKIEFLILDLTKSNIYKNTTILIA